MKDTLVMKFGGTSVGSVQAIKQVIAIAHEAKNKWQNVAIVVSAMSGVTNQLLQGAKCATEGNDSIATNIFDELKQQHIQVLEELAPNADAEREKIEELLREFVALCHAIYVLGEASLRAQDAIASIGERMSAPLIAAALNQAGVPACEVDTRNLIVTDSVFQFASPDMKATQKQTEDIVNPIFDAGQIPVLTGFIGASQEGVTTTLGRGGSDYSAAIFGVTLEAQEVWIWTDVSGVMSTDPRIELSAQTIPEITYREISELAYYGAKVLHPKTIRPALEHGITLWVKNTFDPTSASTRIIEDGNGQKGHIRAVTAIHEQCLITVEGRGMLGVPGIAARLFVAVARNKTSVVMISQGSSEQSICFVVPSSARQTVIEELEAEFRREIERRDIDRISASDDCAIVTVVGAGMRSTPGIAGKIFSAVGKAKVNVVAIAQGSSECSISLVVDSLEAGKAIRAIHQLIVS